MNFYLWFNVQCHVKHKNVEILNNFELLTIKIHHYYSPHFFSGVEIHQKFPLEIFDNLLLSIKKFHNLKEKY